MRRTSTDEIYSELGKLIKSATGRQWWRKAGIQSRPKAPYALIWLSESQGVEKPIVTMQEYGALLATGEIFEQIPWGTSEISVGIEFHLSRVNDSALNAAHRMKSSLYLTQRYWDIWNICSLSGGVRIIDLSTIFGEDIEDRAECRFTLLANVVEPLPLKDKYIYDIEHQKINIAHNKIDDEKTNIEVNIQNDENIDDYDSNL